MLLGLDTTAVTVAAISALGLIGAALVAVVPQHRKMSRIETAVDQVNKQVNNVENPAKEPTLRELVCDSKKLAQAAVALGQRNEQQIRRLRERIGDPFDPD